MTSHPRVLLRREVLDRMDEVQLAELLRRVPVLADALHGQGPLAPTRIEMPHGWVPYAPPATRETLALLLTETPGIHSVLCTLTILELRLLTLAEVGGGVLRRSDVVRELGEEGMDVALAAIDVLASRVLGTHGNDDELFRPFAEATRLVALPGVALDPTDPQDFTSARVQAALRLLDADRPDVTRKDERIELLADLLADPTAMQAIHADLPQEAREILDVLVDVDVVRLSAMGIHWYPSDPRDVGEFPPTPLHWLTDRGLAWADYYRDEVWTWLEVKFGMRGGRLYDDWITTPPPARDLPIDDPGPFLPSVLVTFEAMLDRLAATPAAGLKSGGIGVRETKALAKDLQVPPTTVAVLVHLALTLGLVGPKPDGKATGRGRKRHQDMVWAPTGRRVAWAQVEPAVRWGLFVQAWIEAKELDECDSDGLPTKVAVDDHRAETRDDTYLRTLRRDVLAVLAGRPSGTGLAESDLFALFGWERPATVHAAAAAGVLAVARVLGLVPAEGPIGLTDLARQVLADPSAVAGAVRTRDGSLVVQADLTVMVPPETSPEVSARLLRYGVVEGEGGVRIVRLGRAQVAAALSDGESAEDVLDFLTTNSRTELPDTVRRLVDDLARSQGRLRAGAAMSYLRSDDEALIASASGVKKAKLTVLAPTVAVSTLSRAKLVEVLRGAGLPLLAEERSGDAVTATTHVAEERWGTDERLPDARAVLPNIAGVAALASSVFQTAGEPITVDQRGRWQLPEG